MTEPSQYFKGRTVQEQMDEVIGYVDTRAGEVAAAKADTVLQPAEEAKTAAQAAAQEAEAAKNATIAALPAIQQDISGLKAEDTALDGRLNTVELKVQTAEGNIVTIQGQITAIENKNTQQDGAITALQAADAQNVKIDRINDYAIGLTGSQQKSGTIEFMSPINPIKLNCSSLVSGIQITNTADDSAVTPTSNMGYSQIVFKDANDVTVGYLRFQHKRTGGYVMSIGTRNSSGSLIDTVIADVS